MLQFPPGNSKGAWGMGGGGGEKRGELRGFLRCKGVPRRFLRTARRTPHTHSSLLYETVSFLPERAGGMKPFPFAPRRQGLCSHYLFP